MSQSIRKQDAGRETQAIETEPERGSFRRSTFPPQALELGTTRSSGFVAGPSLISCRERALAFILGQELAKRHDARGRPRGVQALLATGATGDDAVSLEELTSLRNGGEISSSSAPGDRLERWVPLAAKLEAKLGSPLEPELFSNMLFAAHAGSSGQEELIALGRELLPSFRESDARGLYHFFESLRFAGDVDCTGVAARARLVLGDLDMNDGSAAAALRRITGRILSSAAVRDVTGSRNSSHGKDNGPLRRLVFKVYLDDHSVQGSEYDRGLKHDPVVVVNALYPVLFEIAAGKRSLLEEVELTEFVEGRARPRSTTATVSEIVTANLAHCARHLRSGEYLKGSRYYPSPETFLCFFADLFARFGHARFDRGLGAALRAALETLRRLSSAPSALEAAQRAIAACAVGLDPRPECVILMESQAEDGGFGAFDGLYTLANGAPKLYFGSRVLTALFAVRALSGAIALGATVRR